jgi:hypothetical protein
MHSKTDLIKSLLCIAIVGCGIVLFSSLSHAETYYVTPNGSAVWPACKNINTPCSWQAAMANVVAGDTVYFREGTYDPGASCPSTWENVAMTPALTHSGTAASPITFKAYPGETPIIKACPNAMPAFGARDVSYIIWDGFSSTTVDGTGEVWLFLYWNSTGSVVKNCNFTGNTRSIYKNAAPIRIEQSSDNEVTNNVVHGMKGDSNAVNTAAIWLFDATRAKVHNNTIFNCKNGLMQKTGPNVDNEIYKNYFYSITTYGIMLDEESPGGGSGDKVYQNVLVNVGNMAINVYPGTTTTSEYQTDYLIYNNTIYGSGTGIGTGERARSNQIWNNIIYQLSAGSNPLVRYYTGASMPSYCDYNVFYGSGGVWNLDYATDYSSLATWTPATGFDGHSVTTNPQFLKAGGKNAGDYRRKLYPTNGRGGTYANVMGAYITGNESIGRIPPPANLR